MDAVAAAVVALSSAVRAAFLVLHCTRPMGGKVMVLTADLLVSLVRHEASSMMIWTMPKSVDAPWKAVAEIALDWEQWACLWGNTAWEPEQRTPNVLDGWDDSRVCQVWGMAARTIAVLAAEAYLGPGRATGTYSDCAQIVEHWDIAGRTS